MIKIIIFLIILFPSISFAEVSGYLFLGKYFDSSQWTDLEERKINYRAGIYLEIESKWVTFFMKDETLIGDMDFPRSYPKQINYMLGFKRKIKSLDIIYTHECLHPVDGISNGEKARKYNLIEGRYNF